MEFAFDDVRGGHDGTYRSLLERKLDEVGNTPDLKHTSLTGGMSMRYSARKKVTRTELTDKGLMKHNPSYFTSAIAQSKKETRSVRDQLAKMERRATLAEERAKEASIMERISRAALDARDKQVSSMRLRVRARTRENKQSHLHDISIPQPKQHLDER
jgi:hypothetical protein